MNSLTFQSRKCTFSRRVHETHVFFCRDIAGIQREDLEILNAKFEVLHQHRMQEAEREHFVQIRSLNNEWERCLSQLEDQNAELVVAKGIAAAASLQAQEHLQNLKLIQKELQSAKLGLQLQQEQLKQMKYMNIISN